MGSGDVAFWHKKIKGVILHLFKFISSNN